MITLDEKLGQMKKLENHLLHFNVSGKFLIFLLILILAAGCQSGSYPDYVFKITTEETAPTPVSPLLYSHFIEIGFGYQIAPLMAERFFNRSFEKFPPYNGKSKNSFGLLLKDGRYIKDWSGEAWFHSGYEHDNWYVAPGQPNNPAIITDESTYFVKESPEIDVSMELVEGGCGHGAQSIRVTNREQGRWGGFAQDGKYFEQGKNYYFSGYLKSASGEESVEVRFSRQGKWDEPFFSIRFELDDDFKKYECTVPYTGPSEKVTFSLFLSPETSIEADAFSLLPEDHFYGWKKSTVEVMKKLNPGLIRFPGGCFASFYDWKNGIGDKDLRQPEPSYFWGGLNNNDLGTDEFAMLCNEIGAEMMLCVNMYLPGKRNYLDSERNPWQYSDYDLPQFTDQEKGINDAADWVAYCNLKEGEHPMADLRVKNGHKQPFGVGYWEMDNEAVRWLSAEDYAREVVKYSKAMKAVDPTIKIGMITYDYTEKIPEMLKIAGKYVDFFADRDDWQEGRVEELIVMLDSYNSRNGTKIRYCNTEWQVHPYGAPNPKEEVDERFLYGHRTEIKRAMVLGTWYCGLKTAGYLMHWHRQGGIVSFINFNNLSNTHGQAVIETPKEGAYLTAPGKVYELLSRTPARRPLIIEGYEAERNDMVQGQAAYSLTGDTLVVYALNRTDTARVMEFDYSLLGKDFTGMNISILDADDVFTRNKIDMPDEIRRTDRVEKTGSDHMRLQSPPRSFTQVVLTKQK